MQFLKTLFWMILAVVLGLWGYVNWAPVTMRIWAGLELDIKLPLLVGFAFLVGFLPTFILYRASIWSLQRRLDQQAHAHIVSHPQPVRQPTPASNTPADRVATDSKAWPAQ